MAARWPRTRISASPWPSISPKNRCSGGHRWRCSRSMGLQIALSLLVSNVTILRPLSCFNAWLTFNCPGNNSAIKTVAATGSRERGRRHCVGTPRADGRVHAARSGGWRDYRCLCLFARKKKFSVVRRHRCSLDALVSRMEVVVAVLCLCGGR